uniref:ARAD1A11990p n=1 Tax=Blastobotrys adeninivorans TaxID=409370 RepID=A0A060SXB8_BLAAD
MLQRFGAPNYISPNLLLKQFHFPHYINFSTRPEVLRRYHRLQREARRFFDPLSREILRNYIYESFAAFKYVSQDRKVEALLRKCDESLLQLRRANKGDPKAMLYVLNSAFSLFMVKEFPLRSLLGGMRRWDRYDLAYQVHNMPFPDYHSFEDHFERAQRKHELFFAYCHALKKNGIRKDQNDRRVPLTLEIPGTFTGAPLPQSRERNIVKRHYSELMKLMPRPIHPQVFAYVEEQYLNENLSRLYRHRLRTFLSRNFTVKWDEEGMLKLVFASVPSSRYSDGFYSGLLAQKKGTNKGANNNGNNNSHKSTKNRTKGNGSKTRK